MARKSFSLEPKKLTANMTMYFRVLCWDPHLQAWFNCDLRPRQESHSSMPEAKDRDSWPIWKLHCSHVQHSTALDLSESAPAISEKSHALLHATCLETSNDSKSIPVSHKITFKKFPCSISQQRRAGLKNEDATSGQEAGNYGVGDESKHHSLDIWQLGATEWDQLSSRPKNTGNQRSHR